MGRRRMRGLARFAPPKRNAIATDRRRFCVFPLDHIQSSLAPSAVGLRPPLGFSLVGPPAGSPFISTDLVPMRALWGSCSLSAQGGAQL